MTALRLAGRAALVTGAASGIGAAIARRFAAEGAKVAIADLDAAAANAMADAVTAEGGTALAIEMDVTDEASVDGGVAQAAGRLGGLDIMVSNAGIQIVAPLVDFDFTLWRKMLAVHLDGAFLATRAALRVMAAAGRGGTILYIGSVHSKEASVLKAPYVTAKHGLLGLAKVVAKEGAAYGVRSNVICPGFVRTPLVEKQIPEQAAALGIGEDEVIRDVMLRDTVDGEFTTLADVAETAVFLAAFPSNAMTGQSVTVSHGWGMR